MRVSRNSRVAIEAISHGRTAATNLFSGVVSCGAIVMRRASVESMLMELASLHLAWTERSFDEPQVRHAFDVRRLRKHVQRNYSRYPKDILGA